MTRRLPLYRFGQRIQTLRKEQNMTVEDLAARADLSWEHLYKIEAGRYEPKLLTVIKLADALDIPLDMLRPSKERRSNKGEAIEQFEAFLAPHEPKVILAMLQLCHDAVGLSKMLRSS